MIRTGISDPLQTDWVIPGAYAGRIGLTLWGRLVQQVGQMRRTGPAGL